MADPGLTQVTNAISTQIARDGVNVFVDRDESEPIQPEERPAIVVRVAGGPLNEANEQGESVINWRPTFELDHYIDTDSAANITFAHNQMVADTWALLVADRTLGNLASMMTPAEVSSDPDRVADVGVATFSLEVWFDTAFDDFTRIIF